MRTKKDILNVFKKFNLNPEIYLGVSFNILDKIYTIRESNHIECEGLYIHSFYSVKGVTPVIWVRPIRDRKHFEFVCMHELGHHVHHAYMPTLTNNWNESQKEEFANNFANSGYESYQI